MTPEEKALLERTLKLSEDNNKILLSLRRSVRLATFWGLMKVVLIVGPLILGYIYLEPYFGAYIDTLKSAQSMLQGF